MVVEGGQLQHKYPFRDVLRGYDKSRRLLYQGTGIPQGGIISLSTRLLLELMFQKTCPQLLSLNHLHVYSLLETTL